MVRIKAVKTIRIPGNDDFLELINSLVWADFDSKGTFVTEDPAEQSDLG